MGPASGERGLLDSCLRSDGKVLSGRTAGKQIQSGDEGSTDRPPSTSSHQLAVRKGLEST